MNNKITSGDFGYLVLKKLKSIEEIQKILEEIFIALHSNEKSRGFSKIADIIISGCQMSNEIEFKNWIQKAKIIVQNKIIYYG